MCCNYTRILGMSNIQQKEKITKSKYFLESLHSIGKGLFGSVFRKAIFIAKKSIKL